MSEIKATENFYYYGITNSVSFCSEIEVVELIETNFFF